MFINLSSKNIWETILHEYTYIWGVNKRSNIAFLYSFINKETINRLLTLTRYQPLKQSRHGDNLTLDSQIVLWIWKDQVPVWHFYIRLEFFLPSISEIRINLSLILMLCKFNVVAVQRTYSMIWSNTAKWVKHKGSLGIYIHIGIWFITIYILDLIYKRFIYKRTTGRTKLNCYISFIKRK